MNNCKCIVFPSESAKDIFMNIYPELGELGTVIEHGYKFEEEKKYSILKENEILELGIEKNKSKKDGIELSGWFTIEKNLETENVQASLIIEDSNVKIPVTNMDTGKHSQTEVHKPHKFE